MRDAERIRERVWDGLIDNRVTWITLAGVVGIAAVFGAGYSVGRRAERLEGAEVAGNPTVAPGTAAAQALDHNLKFYTDLTGKGPKDVPPEPAAPPSPAARVVPTPHALATPIASAPGQKVSDSDRPPFTDAADREASLAAALLRGPASAGQYTVQVSSFPSQDEAKAFSSALERKGFRPYVVSADLAGKGTWYRVRIGRFDTEEQARQAKGVLARSDIPAWVLRSE